MEFVKNAFMLKITQKKFNSTEISHPLLTCQVHCSEWLSPGSVGETSLDGLEIWRFESDVWKMVSFAEKTSLFYFSCQAGY